ncbi:RNA polymerase, sigma 27/28 subunit, RpsK/SigK [Desulfitobacterium dichloroeliminans LMG P-21439]|uniref:RNA polymerase sigma factor n=1 Tax=Desulfitobacterium dichloroeliminans (strain LMG P-21439 / DCA1) TaxID=871963 RepID=L0FA27_DESDL|nr:RNA polymerase sporulation sigma factor SigK [Desulfitobacterium dichloroeliminans]AGA69890.1 RNA polymerase, sigma 27/28 subunit, RpsK/SigK [Desulfitobacterium dichloroeliminans LMG P-21439]
MLTEILVVSVALTVLKGVTLLVSYINNNAFPQPLNEKDEAHYLQILRASKNPEVTAKEQIKAEYARNKLVEHNLRLVAHLVKKFDGTGEDSDDLISIGTIGLIKGIDTFDLGKGTKLATYAARCIENEILMHLRSLKKSRGEISIYDPIGVDKEGNEISLMDVLAFEGEAISDRIESEFEQRVLLDKVKNLTRRERLVLQLRYGLMNSPRRTQREIAKALGISRSYVSRIEKKAIQKLMEQMEDHDPRKS